MKGIGGLGMGGLEPERIDAMWYNHLSDYEVRMMLIDAAQECFKEGTIKVLNEMDAKASMGNKYQDYLNYRSLGKVPNPEFHDLFEGGKKRAMTPYEAMREKGMPKEAHQKAAIHATKRFSSWWKKNVKDDHPANKYAEYKYIDGAGDLFRRLEDGQAEYLSPES